jgi:hypothetical protein
LAFWAEPEDLDPFPLRLEPGIGLGVLVQERNYIGTGSEVGDAATSRADQVGMGGQIHIVTDGLLEGQPTDEAALR